MKNRDSLYHSEQNTYQTGSTNPPKSYQGIIAVLLILVIFLGGIVGILSMLNIRLFRLLEAEKTSSVEFSQASEPAKAAAISTPEDGFYASNLGLTVHEIANLYRSYHELPSGVYISDVTPDGPGAKANLLPGDILLKVNHIPVESQASFETAVADLTPGTIVTVTIFRDGQELTLTVTAD